MSLPLRFLLCLFLTAASHGEEPLAAPPLVSAKAWAIADGATGQFLWGGNADEPLKTASTTKTMCAHVVLRLVAKDPKVLSEKITFSKLAAGTGGSACEIEEGEQVSVLDGLYALMLPSGNDMGNAFAEHFNGRFAPPDASSPPEISTPAYATRANFITEMNRIAASLSLKQTKYRSAFGDGGGASDVTTSARELLVVAHAAMQDPLFRKVVSTERYIAKVQTPDGAQREYTWQNSNKLLALPGYNGVKTGTTITAGSCLVASGHHSGKHLLVAVIGSTTDNGRYLDTRNLFRWAWREIVTRTK